MENIEQYRIKIDEIDEQIQQLITARAKIALKIFKEKQKNNIPIYDPKRESEILKMIINKNKGPLANEHLINIYKAIIFACRSLGER